MNRAPRPTRCYYEVLDVARDASPDELKSAYRKLVLVWHPDKNPHRAEEATDKFKEIQNAYSILSDPNERSWYDNHRDSILKGVEEGDEDSHGINLWPYFSANCFWGYGDDDEGFYAVYRKVFETLDAEERDAVSDSKEPYRAAPSFGNAKTPYAEVKKFYSYWKEFMSRKSFGWAEKYHLSEAPNRQVRRLIEKDNKKARDEKKKEFIQTVRHLAQIVQRLDKRVLEGAQAEKLEKEERDRETAQLRKQHEAERKKRQLEARAKWAQEHVDEEHEKMLEALARSDDEAKEDEEEKEKGEGKEGAAHIDGNDEETEELAAEEDEEEAPKPTPKKSQTPKLAIIKGKEKKKKPSSDSQELYCAACKKKFKSDSQWRNHEQSKKHKETVEKLRDELLLSDEYEEEEEEAEEEEKQIKEKKEDPKKKSSAPKKSQPKAEGEAEGDIKEKMSSLSLDEKPSSKKNAKAETPPPATNKKKKAATLAPRSSATEDDDLLLLASFAKKKTPAAPAPVDESDEEEEPKPKPAAKASEKKKIDLAEEEVKEGEGEDEDEMDTQQDGEKAPKVKKKPRRRQTKDEKPASAVKLYCAVCKTNFDTRNQLFTHIRTTGHARPPGFEAEEATKGGKKKH